jgi:hypothetical protein
MGAYELAERHEGGVLVRLIWDSVRNQAVLRYRDRASGDTFVTDVPNGRALLAFRHPHAYRPRAS